MTTASRVAGFLVSVLVIGLSSGVFAQGLPTDWRPFVRLGYEASVQRYRNPVIWEGRPVWDPVNGPRREIIPLVGSGTVLTRDGLILTNYHVYEVVSSEPSEILSEDRQRRVTITSLSRDMLVYENDPQHPFRPPALKYRAKFVAGDPKLDIVLLKIHTPADGGPLEGQDFSAMPLGNPYGIPLDSELHIIGYPGKGGDTMTRTKTEFLGYMKGVPYVLDGSFKTVATIAGGNSGGAALFNNQLVGVPTRVSFKGEKGADFGYIHPVTWALRSFAEAALRYSQQIPQIDPEWVNSEENADITRTRIFLGGKVISAFAVQAVDKADVLFHRTDRILEQIIELDKERAQIRRALEIRALLERGLSAAQIAQVRKLTIEEVRQLTNVELDEGAWSADLQRYFRGEFFYDFDKTRPDGFFLVAVPRK